MIHIKMDKEFIFINIDSLNQATGMSFEENKIYVCKSEVRADFICPCGCKQIISLNLLKGSTPLWKINGNSITPSINRIVGCKSHFYITKGKYKLA